MAATPRATGRSMASSPFAFSIDRGGKTEVEMHVLPIAAVLLVGVWVIVLWGSRYFGPR
jgi:hypothetical protein